MSAILHNQFSSFCFTFEQDIVIIFLMLPFLYVYTINCIFAHFGIRCAHCLIGHFYITTMCIINWQQAVSTIMQPCSFHPFWRLILFLIYWTFSSCPYDGRGIFWDCRIIDYCRGYSSLFDTAVTSYFFLKVFGYGVIQPTPAVHVHTQVQVWFFGICTRAAFRCPSNSLRLCYALLQPCFVANTLPAYSILCSIYPCPVAYL